MKKKGFSLLLLPFLFSCTTASLPYQPYSYGDLVTNPFVEEVGDGYKKVADWKTLQSADESNISPSFSSIYQSKGSGGVEHYNLPSTGIQKLLVIPVDFAEATGESLGDNAISSIKKAFFGADKNNQSLSVASFYEKSSYGRLQIKGKVDPAWFRSPYSASELRSKTSQGDKKAALDALYTQALAWHDATYPDDPSSNYAFTAEAGESKIPVYLVYSAPYVDSSSMLWAFSVNAPNLCCWSSYAMLQENDGKVDAHTFIHEVGHLLGLKDYYDTRSASPFVAPLGRVDMMDCSLGDHNAYSKMLLDWTRPYVADDIYSSQIHVTLAPFSSSGDCFLYSPKWNGTPYDEYYLFEFYTPFGVNRVDAVSRSDITMKLPSKPGIKVYHVDSRLGVFRNSVGMDGYLSEEISTVGKRLDIAHDNNCNYVGSAIDTSRCLIQLLDASSGSSRLAPNYVVSDQEKEVEGLSLRNALFQQGQGVGELTFHTNSEKLHMRVDQMTNAYAKLTLWLEDPVFA